MPALSLWISFSAALCLFAQGQVPPPAPIQSGSSSDSIPGDLPPPPPGLWNAPSTPKEIVSSILVDENPMSASLLLDSQEIQQAVRNLNPDEFATVFARALEIKDLEKIMMRGSDEVNLRLDILSRPTCRFCWDARKTESWAARDEFITPQTRAALPAVYLEWKALSKEQRKWLSARGSDSNSWSALGLGARWQKLDSWAKEETDALMRMNPSTPGQAKEMEARSRTVTGIEGRAQTAALTLRADEAELATTKLAEARLNAARSKDPAIQQALAQAQSAADPETRLAALSRLFDGLGRPDAAVREAAPAAPDQVFDAQSRRLTADLLRTGLLRETAGTWAGQTLATFYANHPLNIVVAPGERSAIAWYNDDVLTFNESYLQGYVKAHGKSIGDLAHDPSLLGGLMKEVAPTFVHEATHQIQDAWAHQLSIPFEYGEGVEAEAKTVAALYVLQKERIDPSYRKYVAANFAVSRYVREDVNDADDLRSSGASFFGSWAMTEGYAGYPSIASSSWTNIYFRDQVAAAARAELERRSKLSAGQRQTLSAQGDLKEKYGSLEAFYADFKNVNDEALRALLGKMASGNQQEIQNYNQYAGRLRDVDKLTDERLKTLGSAPTDAVPLPSSVKQ